MKMQSQKGSILILSLIFSTIFLLVLGAILSLIQVRRIATQREAASIQAMTIAEAGIDYYRWHLAHMPKEFAQDTGIHDFKDPFGGTIGRFELQVTPPQSGSTIVTIRSTGWTLTYPNLKRIVEIQYGIPSLTKFAFLTNNNVWFGQGEEVKGPLHSNGGVRMDGEADSLVTSALETYICGLEHDCNNEVKPGVWGTGEIQELWKFPEPMVDFATITLDLGAMETEAIDNGFFLGPSGVFGYRLTFLSNGKFTVEKVTALHPRVYGYNGTQWVYESNDYKTVQSIPGMSNLTIPADGLLYFQDRIWVEGTVNGRATVVAARTQQQGGNANILIQNNITYAPNTNSALALIAQKDVLVPLRSPDTMEIDGALLAQSGHVFRYYYPPSFYPQYALRDKIETYGTIITNTVWTWSWVNDANGPVVSGYEITETTYDTKLLFAPPPFFPSTGEYERISWDERLLNQ
ncbi:MAG: hypothetical protein A3B74_01585 [Candidatus Kerfeldbacteria bacterium RIFCSPHIGHO2_02_FULL_42_14]|uniref:Type 4 fimbrial biogenesis protein PilX N-terminal domain-containing protein n=1 Tax=Candidatus Kerfeldbacteria bacterium RIFCSPHIGHO2_02_FULL_42_14 TaxID=1798540 RepID=A0A1G2ATC1_9BACT|nr:MAG: hypothetical protein A3B74_01585 [Candidatus Kerfeldbacteria bacterium RIFCSPHIGHO2_02_FULL_42_14]OGY82310.1 MAG: hypothetical protein A3E60_03785 [Candidatus Kerfeldbacteria bacterium RIFCSPHIGHO2_12_FULL_42_13]OGY84738.1 MAG: hypothetical protein A3I91_05585 [Candidatus Kerfeldbacteria bacterium RIFCSPLOWO2_02_FULL_42_19]OGY85969.1 MAG: hypothetical protein A3G01_03490 [Candidatus Kerfeldbacteria bacterium RIFCSPLOWO2_12_FULL_43_9]